MLCSACGSEIDVKGLFPSAKVHCSCGATQIVPKMSAAGTSPAVVGGDGPFRSADRPSDKPVRQAKTRASHPSVSCPRCATPLDSEGGPPGCARCGGVFLDLADLERLRESSNDEPFLVHAPEGHVVVSTAAYISCPYCHAQMERRVFEGVSGIAVDICAKHGTWFDGGELAGAARLPHAREHVKQRDAMEAKHVRTNQTANEMEAAERQAELVTALASPTLMDLVRDRREVRLNAWFASEVIEDLIKVFR